MADAQGSRKIEAFGLQFSTLKELLDCVGYGSLTSRHQLVKRHGSIEAFIKMRLKTDDDAVAAQKLRHLQDAVHAKTSRPADPAIDKLISMGIERLLFSSDADATIVTVKGLYNDARSADELKQTLLQRSRELQQQQ